MNTTDRSNKTTPSRERQSRSERARERKELTHSPLKDQLTTGTRHYDETLHTQRER
eukprot:COSAG02_NODE_31132_length_538_cov_4.337520_1_plen_55_part_10